MKIKNIGMRNNSSRKKQIGGTVFERKKSLVAVDRTRFSGREKKPYNKKTPEVVSLYCHIRLFLFLGSVHS